jgi:Family of unknown function (DUF6111)
MGRVIFELSGFFFLPFIAYAAFLIWQHGHPRAAHRVLHKKALQIQVLIGLIFVVAALFVLGLADEKRIGGYAPAEFRNGQLVPGKIE